MPGVVRTRFAIAASPLVFILLRSAYGVALQARGHFRIFSFLHWVSGADLLVLFIRLAPRVVIPAPDDG